MKTCGPDGGRGGLNLHLCHERTLPQRQFHQAAHLRCKTSWVTRPLARAGATCWHVHVLGHLVVPFPDHPHAVEREVFLKSPCGSDQSKFICVCPEESHVEREKEQKRPKQYNLQNNGNLHLCLISTVQHSPCSCCVARFSISKYPYLLIYAHKRFV